MEIRLEAMICKLYSDGGRQALICGVVSSVGYEVACDIFSESVFRALTGRCKARNMGELFGWFRQDMRFAVSNYHAHRAVERKHAHLFYRGHEEAYELPDERVAMIRR